MSRELIFFIGYLAMYFVAHNSPGIFSQIEKGEYAFSADIFISGLVNIPAAIYLFLNIDTSFWALLIMFSVSIEFSAACMDYKYKKVYDAIHLGAWAYLVPLFFVYHKFPWEALVVAGVALILSFGYGFSDALAFAYLGFVVEAWLLVVGIPTNSFTVIFNSLVLMAASCVVFSIIQIAKKNITKTGRTKNKTAFIPYIFFFISLVPIFLFLAPK